jgi:hypothetical protein|tara:strand:- start:1619 stop:1882 length:264 start_codon:yes stop_codon:yes gene_type:complete
MIKELKYLIFISIILFFIFFTLKFYFSDENKKNSYRSLNNINKTISLYSNLLPILKNDTNNVVKYINQEKNKKKKKYNFWNLLNPNE